MVATLQKLYRAYDEQTGLKEKIIYGDDSMITAYLQSEKKIEMLEKQLRQETSI